MWKVVLFVADENRDLNGHPEDEIKRQRTQYNGDQLYSNVSTTEISYIRMWVQANSWGSRMALLHMEGAASTSHISVALSVWELLWSVE
jgi:hypothetical protein